MSGGFRHSSAEDAVVGTAQHVVRAGIGILENSQRVLLVRGDGCQRERGQFPVEAHGSAEWDLVLRAINAIYAALNAPFTAGISVRPLPGAGREGRDKPLGSCHPGRRSRDRRHRANHDPLLTAANVCFAVAQQLGSTHQFEYWRPAAIGNRLRPAGSWTEKIPKNESNHRQQDHRYNPQEFLARVGAALKYIDDRPHIRDQNEQAN